MTRSLMASGMLLAILAVMFLDAPPLSAQAWQPDDGAPYLKDPSPPPVTPSNGPPEASTGPGPRLPGGFPSLTTSLLLACDSCGCSVIPYDEKSAEKGWVFGVGEQFTDFDKLQTEGQPVANANNEFIHSSITQILVGYNFNDRNGLTLTVPYVDRSFHRLFGPIPGTNNFNNQTANVSGLGDCVLQDRYVFARHQGSDYTEVASISGGFKLPTGDPSELNEEVGALLGGPDSVVGGHDIALGSGSLDSIVGVQFAYHRQAWLVDTIVQFAARNPGFLGYRYGNEFQYDVSVGRYLHSSASSGRFVALALDVEGESKNEDRFAGNILVVDTGANETYIGPKLTASLGEGRFASFDLALPLHEYNTDTQLVPSYRVKGSFLLRY